LYFLDTKIAKLTIKSIFFKLCNKGCFCCFMYGFMLLLSWIRGNLVFCNLKKYYEKKVVGVYYARAYVWASSMLFKQRASYLLVEEHQFQPRCLKLYDAFYHGGRSVWCFEGRLASYNPFLFVSSYLSPPH
jgi:hypothetical protein